MRDAQFDYGAPVRLVRSVRDDGSFPGKQRGDLLVRKGALGYVRDVGTILQDQVIYQVYFMELGYTVGCRAQELISGDDPWIESEFEFGDWVEAASTLVMAGKLLAQVGERGQVMSVRRDLSPLLYEVLFGARMLQVPLSAIRWPMQPELLSHTGEEVTL
jgi:nitrogen fixation protein NifZ